MGRRFFLQVTAATGVAMGCNLRRAPEKLVPYLVPPEDGVPGVPLFYRTLCRGCSARCRVTARTREGRAIKLEGNPEDPIGRGALCARGQAELQALYAPDRFQGPQQRDAAGKLSGLSWDDATDRLAKSIWAAKSKGPGAVRLLTRPEPGAAGALQRAFLQKLGAGERLAFEPLELSPLRAASEALFGRAELPVFDLALARSVVSFGADFTE